METTEKSLVGTRILYAITKSNWGGAQAYVYALALGASEAGALVEVAMGGANGTTSETGLLASRLADASILVTPLLQIKRDLGLTHEIKAFFELVRSIKKSHPDVLHLNSSKMGLLGALAGRLAGVPRIVFTAHGWPHRESRSVIWKTTIWIASWFTILFSHKVIVVSECDLKTAPIFFSRNKLVRIYNGIKDFPLRAREDARAAYISRAPELAHFTTWLLMNAELHTNKGIDIAIKALAELAPRYPTLALVVAGDGSERGRLRELAQSLGIADRVHFLGFVTDARTYLKAADIYLMPSRKEGFPMTLLEAGIASLSVVASSTGGIPELIQDSKNGLLIAPNNHRLLAEAIASLLSNPQLSEQLGSALHIRVLTEFSSSQMTSKTFLTYKT